VIIGWMPKCSAFEPDGLSVIVWFVIIVPLPASPIGEELEMLRNSVLSIEKGEGNMRINIYFRFLCYEM